MIFQLIETLMFITVETSYSDEVDMHSGPTSIVPTLRALRRRDLCRLEIPYTKHGRYAPLTIWDLGSIYEIKFL